MMRTLWCMWVQWTEWKSGCISNFSFQTSAPQNHLKGMCVTNRPQPGKHANMGYKVRPVDVLSQTLIYRMSNTKEES